MPPYKFTPEYTELSSIKKELRPLEDIASSAETIANSAKTQSELAVEKSKKADIKGWIAVGISAFALLIEITNPTSETVIFDGFFSFLSFIFFTSLSISSYFSNSDMLFLNLLELTHKSIVP